MSLNLSYMGTKRHLADHVARLAADCRSGPLLDLFSGMCAIGRAVAPSRPIWSNDLQYFACQVAKAQFEAGPEKINVDRLGELVAPLAEANRSACYAAFAKNLNIEEVAGSISDVDAAEGLYLEGLSRAQESDRYHQCLPAYSLFAARYAGSYLGYAQAIEVDSIRYGLDNLLFDERINDDHHRAALVALGAAISRVSTTTGHFAQPLKPKKTNATKHFSQRRRSIRSEWLKALSELNPSGSFRWRSKNKTFQADALNLLDDLRSEKQKPSVVYADPPYTKDQYSRFYHLLETAILYDFPLCSGTGLYRSDRASSAFSQQSKVEESIDRMIASTKKLGADLILSYPEDGLLHSSTKVIPRIIHEHYKKEPDIIRVDHNHSTMGASKGAHKHQVREILYKVSA